MKKSTMNRLLSVALIGATVGIFGSCKDNEEDLYADLHGQLAANQVAQDAKLADVVTQQKAGLEELKNQLEDFKNSMNSCECNFEQQMQDYWESLMNGGVANANLASYIQSEIAKYQVGGQTLDQAISSINGQISTLNSNYSSLDGKVTTLATDISNTNIVATDAKNLAMQALTLAKLDSVRIDGVENDLQALEGRFNSVVYAWSDSLKTAYDNASAAYAQATTNAQLIEALGDKMKLDSIQISNALIDSVQHLRDEAKVALDSAATLANQAYENALIKILEVNGRVDSVALELSNADGRLNDRIDSVAAVLLTTETTLKDLTVAYEKADSVLQDQIDDLYQMINGEPDGLATKISQVYNACMSAIEDLEAKFKNTLANLVTGIIIQATENPVYGTFALPFDVRSNVLMGYTGQSILPKTRNFPTDASFCEPFRVNDDETTYITSKDLAVLKSAGLKTITIESGHGLYDENEDGKVYAGKVYLTVNPNTVNFENMIVSLENSQGVASGMELTPLKKSNKTLTFGYTYTRAANNGFYEADAVIAKENVSSVKVNIEPGLKSAMVDAFKEIKESINRNDIKRPNIDYTKLISLVYNQFNGILDANGVSATYYDAYNEAHSVYSEYNVAATAFTPLSFKALYDLEAKVGHIRTFNPFNEVSIMDDINIDLKLDPIKIELDDDDYFNIHFDKAHIEYDGTIRVEVMQPKVEDGALVKDEKGDVVYEPILINVEKGDLEDFIRSIENSFNNQVDGWDETVNAELNKQIESIIGKIEDQLNGMIEDINGQLKDVNDLVNTMNDLQNQVNSYIKKANSYISRLNSAINSLNGFLDNVNNYLQPTMMYEINASNETLHQMSTNRLIGSPMKVGSSVALYPTTYTAELVVPIYKKFVAVTNVYKGLNSIATQELINELNSQEGLNEVLRGKTRAVTFTVPNRPELVGANIEIVYSAIDYKGYSSTRKFYIYVK